jgi:hypothetical protein
VLPHFNPSVYGIIKSVRPSVPNRVELLLKKKHTERQKRSYYCCFILCAVHYILLREMGRGLERKERCWKCRQNLTSVALYVCCLIITNERSVNIKWWLLKDFQLFFTKYKMSAWCGEHVRPSVIYQWLKRPSYCDIRDWSYFKKLWSRHDFNKYRLSDSHTLRKTVHELFLPVFSIFLADLGNIRYHAHVKPFGATTVSLWSAQWQPYCT